MLRVPVLALLGVVTLGSPACAPAEPESGPTPRSVDLLATPFTEYLLTPRAPAPAARSHLLTSRTLLDGSLSEIARGDTLVASRANAAQGFFRVAVPALDPAFASRFCFDYRGDAKGFVRLGLRKNRSSRREESRLVAPVTGRGTWDHVCFDLAGLLLEDESILDLSIHPPDAEAGEIAITEVELHERGIGSVCVLKLAEQTRRCLALAGGTEARWELVIPTGAVLSFGYAVRAAGWKQRGDGTLFRVTLGDGDGTVLWERYLAPHFDESQRDWHEAQVDLGGYAGQAVALRLQALASPPRRLPFHSVESFQHDRPVFAAPRLDVRGDTRPNVLVLVIDTLRADGVLHPKRDTTPRLEELRDRSVRFQHAYATASWTHPSVGSLMTGLYPTQHGLGTASGGGLSSFRPGMVLMPEYFRAAGYATAAISNNPIVDAEAGFGAGIDLFDTRSHPSYQIYGAQRVTQQALRWLADRPAGPFFLYLHYFDPHDRYQAPGPFTRRYVASEGEVEPALHQGKPNELLFKMHTEDGALTGYQPSAFAVEYLRGLYDAEVGYLDQWVGRLLDELNARDQLRNTLVVFTSDHGEEFLEHGYLKHGHSLYDEQIHVPLWIKFPGDTDAGRTLDDRVSLVDVLPTILAATGIQTEWAGPGMDLRRLVRGDAPPRRTLFAVSFPSQATPAPILRQTKGVAIDGPWKLHAQMENQTYELFHLDDDPEEQVNLADQEPAILDRLLAETRGHLQGDSLQIDPRGTISPEILEKLKALGYVH